MLDVIASFVVLFGLAWLVRALVGARELTWPRVLLATAAGWGVGDFIALAMVSDFEHLAEVDYAQIQTVAFPFRLIAAMGAIVVLELLRSSQRRRTRRRRPIRAARNLGRVVVRAARVLIITLRHGLAPLLGLRRRDDITTRSPEELARRVRLALEDAGGMFVKLGQLLATRPDLLPPAALAELGRLHAGAAPLARDTVEELMAEEVGGPLDHVFERIDWDPIGSASIAQAHAARLADGREVVIKIQRPGLAGQVDVDLTIVMWLARMAARRTTWGKAYEVDVLAGEFADSLRGELDFRIEARNAIESGGSPRNPGVAVPAIIDDLTTSRLLVMERLRGVPLSNLPQPLPADVARRLADELCVSQVTAMLQGDRFHGDPHPGNVMVMDTGGVGLIDFGITGRLDAFERASVFQILVALRLEHPTLLYEAMVSMGAVGPAHDPGEIERAFAQFMTAYLGSGLPPPEALTDLMRLTTELHLHLPASTTTMFRALATLAGTLEQLSPGYPIIDVVAELGGSEFRERVAPDSMRDFVEQEFAKLAPLLSRAPRHFDRLATLAEHGRLTTRVRLFTDPDEVRILERLVNRFVLTLLSIGVGAVSVMMLGTEGGPVLEAADAPLLEILGWVGLTLAVILLLRVLLSVLRTE
ncbi:MAG TPA: AarF/UbiB family protein [Acidimicrobiia bacterium]|nr:AarF/UbiB family protein [Acidimicrobiia bacterium]